MTKRNSPPKRPPDPADFPDMRWLLTLTAIMAAALAVGCDGRNVHVSATPLEIVSETPGRGREAHPGDIVTIDYRVILMDGKTLLAEKDFVFELGAGSVVDGINEAVTGMRVGGKRLVDCPPHKHWGSAGYGDGLVPPRSHLLFDLKLKAVD